MLIPKQKIIRDRAFRMWIASLPCLKCKIYGRSQAAHLDKIGKGIKGCDSSCRPLCTVSFDGLGCHEKHDQYLEEDYWKLNRRIALDLPIYPLWQAGKPDIAMMMLARF